MDSSPESQPEKVELEATDKTVLKDRKLSNKGQFTIPQKKLQNIKVQHKDTGVFLIDETPFTNTIYVTEAGIRSAVDSAAQKALNLEKGDTINITLLKVLPNKESEVQ